MSRKGSTLRGKLKAACREERLQKWKEYFKNMLGNPLEVIVKPIQKYEGLTRYQARTIYCVRTWRYEKKIQNRKTATIEGKSLEVWKKENLSTYFFDYATLSRNKAQWRNGWIVLFSFPKKGDLGTNKNYRDIIPSAIPANVCNGLFLNCIQLEIEKILKKIKRNRSTISYILTIRYIIERVHDLWVECSPMVWETGVQSKVGL